MKKTSIVLTLFTWGTVGGLFVFSNLTKMYILILTLVDITYEQLPQYKSL